MRFCKSLVVAQLIITAGCHASFPSKARDHTPAPSLAARSQSFQTTASTEKSFDAAANTDKNSNVALKNGAATGLSLATFVQEEQLQSSNSRPSQIQESDSDHAEWNLEKLEQLALSNNPALAEERAKIAALQGKWLQVGLKPNTQIGYSGQQMFSGGKAEQIGMYFGETLVRGQKLELNREVVCREIEVAKEYLSAKTQSVLTDVRLSFYETLTAQRRLEISTELLRIAEETSRTVAKLVEAKEATKIDVLRASVATQTAALELKTSENGLQAARSRLAAVTGLPKVELHTLAGDLEAISPELFEDEIRQKLLNESPELLAILKDQDRANAALNRAQAEPIPDVQLEAVVQNDNGTGGQNANLQVTFPIPWRDRNQGGINQARSEVTAAAFAIEKTKLNLQHRFATAFQRYMNAKNLLQDYAVENGILDNARMTLELTRKAHMVGEIGYLDLMEAQKAYSQTNLRYVEALGDLWASNIELDGMLLKGSLDK